MFFERYNYNRTKKRYLELYPLKEIDYSNFINSLKDFKINLLETKCICGQKQDQLISSMV